ncbi:MAG: isopentenyl-diphosphate Delta-isomerase [Alphaproteobacteria bacterium]|nr:isopentenyl-diphosphate Delta-isomerase [Alphaproteobacteria bacterium]
MTNLLVLIDEDDNEIGTMDKLAAHEQGLLHRAVSVVLFQKENPELVLIQQRAAEKYHCPLLWANTCCSHPYPGEAPVDAAYRRVVEELDFALPPDTLVPAGTYKYRAQVGDLVEHEITHVFTGYISKETDIPLNPKEAAAAEWLPAAALPKRSYAPWMNGVIEKALAALRVPAVPQKEKVTCGRS